MRTVLQIVAMSMTLGACAPLAMFASSSPEYQSQLGVQVQSASVNTLCMSPALRMAIWEFEGKFGTKVVMTSGYRTPWHNASAGGARSSYHTKCMAVDFFIPGVSKQKLINFAMNSSSVGGLGCYPGRKYIHIDVRSRPAGYSKPVTWSC